MGVHFEPDAKIKEFWNASTWNISQLIKGKVIDWILRQVIFIQFDVRECLQLPTWNPLLISNFMFLLNNLKVSPSNNCCTMLPARHFLQLWNLFKIWKKMLKLTWKWSIQIDKIQWMLVREILAQSERKRAGSRCFVSFFNRNYWITTKMLVEKVSHFVLLEVFLMLK